MTTLSQSDAVAWGALAKQLYSPSSRYGVSRYTFFFFFVILCTLFQIVPLCILIGLAIPLPFWYLHQHYPKARLDGFITPMVCTQIGYFSTGISSAYVSHPQRDIHHHANFAFPLKDFHDLPPLYRQSILDPQISPKSIPQSL